MDKLIRNYYDGFEGEPEIKFIIGADKGERTVVSIWDGYFDDIMRQFKPMDSGWEGLAYYYHLAIGWENGEPWEIPNICSALAEFQIIDPNKLEFNVSGEVLSVICDLLATAIKENKKVWIDKD